MPKEVSILKHQSLIDIAIQETGTIEALYQIALDNGVSILENTPGRIIKIKQTPVNHDVLRVYKKNKIVPATGLVLKQSSSYVEEDYWQDGYSA